MNHDTTLHRQASAYARATTNARCSRLGHCDNCSVRYCDYKSRYEAFIQGYNTAASHVCSTIDPQAEYNKH